MMSAGLARLALLRQRKTWVLLHRWIGLAMAVFLILAGITGSLLAFYDELDVFFNPQLHAVAGDSADDFLDVVTLREAVVRKHPELWGDALTPWREDRAVVLYMAPRDPTAPPADDEYFVDPYTGALLGSRRWGDLSQGFTNLMPFIYRFHYTLALGDFGGLVFGIVALLWTLDCFVGFYLTLPRSKPFFANWKTAWGIKYKRLNFDLHRAFGLWTWALLFVLAWSSVAFNLQQVYYPVTDLFLDFREAAPHEEQPPQLNPDMTWRDAHKRGKELMSEAMREHGITGAWREDALRYDPGHGEFLYWIATGIRINGDAYDWFGVVFDGDTGELVRVDPENLPQEKAGDFVTRWLIDMHTASVWGLPFRIFICVMGLVVTMLSITGVIIWWHKRRARHGTTSARR